MPSDDIVRIPLRARDGSIRAYAIVDAADADWANQWRWCLNASGYAKRNEYLGGGGKFARYRSFLLHREILNITGWVGIEGDHIDRDTLNNRRSNLRVVTHAQNGQNRRWRLPESVSRFRGVSWHHVDRKWTATVKLNGKTNFVGYFSTEEDAGAAALEARRRLLPFATD